MCISAIFLAAVRQTLEIEQGHLGHSELLEHQKKHAKSMYQMKPQLPKWYFWLIFCRHKLIATHLDSFFKSSACSRCFQSCQGSLASHPFSEAFASHPSSEAFASPLAWVSRGTHWCKGLQLQSKTASGTPEQLFFPSSWSHPLDLQMLHMQAFTKQP